MNEELKQHIAAIKKSIHVWELTPEASWDRAVRLADRNPETEGTPVAYHVIRGIQNHVNDSAPTFHEAVKAILSDEVGRKITDDQVASVIRFLRNEDEFATVIAWNLELEFAMEGSISTHVGDFALYWDTQNWFMRAGMSCPTMSEAFRRGLLFSALKVGR